MAVRLDPVIKKRLAALQEMWKNAEPKRGFSELADGQYRGKVVSAELGLSKNDNLQVTWTLKVTDGPCKGQTCKRFNQMATDQNMEWLKGDLGVLGLDVDGEDVDSIAAVLPDAADLDIIFKVRHKDEYTNIDFVDIVRDGDGKAEPEDKPRGKKGTKAEEPEPEPEGKGQDGGAVPSKAEVKLMSSKKLRQLAEDLDIKVAKDDDDATIRKAVCAELGY
jgi:hypothetical protein